MTEDIKKLVKDYHNIEKKIINELDTLGKDDCKCEFPTDVVTFIEDFGGVEGITKRCLECGGYIPK